MRVINTLIIGSLALFLLNSEALAQSSIGSFSLNQANQQLSLEQSDYETIYRTEQVPDTCYRDEVQGSRQECHTEYDQQCRYENYPVCQNIPRTSCFPEQVCTTRMDRVCNSHGCVNVPRRECHTENRCTTRYEQVCHTEQRRVCQTYPRQVCVNVPIVVRVPYPCTRTVQVPAGQQLKLHTVANVAIQHANMNEVGPTADVLTATLTNGTVNITAQGNPAFLYRIVGQQRTEQMISATEKVVTYTLSIQATSIQRLNEFLNAQIVSPVLYMNRLEFTFLGQMDVPFKGHLNINRDYRRHRTIGVIDSDFANRAIVTQGTISQLMFSPFGVNALEYYNHNVSLTLSLDLGLLRQGLINPGSLNQIANKNVEARFSAYPKQ